MTAHPIYLGLALSHVSGWLREYMSQQWENDPPDPIRKRMRAQTFVVGCIVAIQYYALHGKWPDDETHRNLIVAPSMEGFHTMLMCAVLRSGVGAANWDVAVGESQSVSVTITAELLAAIRSLLEPAMMDARTIAFVVSHLTPEQLASAQWN